MTTGGASTAVNTNLHERQFHAEREDFPQNWADHRMMILSVSKINSGDEAREA